MWMAQCNVCRKDLPNITDPGAPHYCDRCAPFAQGWVEGVMKIEAALTEERAKRINKFRNQYLQEVIPKRQELKAV